MDYRFHPFPRYYKAGQEVTLADLKDALRIAAIIVTKHPEALPLFEYIEGELAKREKEQKTLERIQALAFNNEQN